MNAPLRLLQAEIRADLQSITQAFDALENVVALPQDPPQSVAVGYYLQVIYSLFESLFKRIASTFGNHITDDTRWHTELLQRMTLQVEGILPAVISATLYHSLNELRGFRHLFRNAYLLDFDPRRLQLLLEHAHTVQNVYHQELTAFMDFLDKLAQLDDAHP